jgi:hypothetical protein
MWTSCDCKPSQCRNCQLPTTANNTDYEQICEVFLEIHRAPCKFGGTLLFGETWKDKSRCKPNVLGLKCRNLLLRANRYCTKLCTSQTVRVRKCCQVAKRLLVHLYTTARSTTSEKCKMPHVPSSQRRRVIRNCSECQKPMYPKIIWFSIVLADTVSKVLEGYKFYRLIMCITYI